MKDIKKLLKDSAQDVLPDEKVRRDIKYRLGIDDEEKEVELGGVKAKIYNHRKAIALCACLLAAVIVVCAFIPLMKKSENPGNLPGTGHTLSASEEVYGFSAATAGIVMGNMQSAESAAASTAKKVSATLNYAAGAGNKAVLSRAQAVDDEQIISTINGYMELVETLIYGSGFDVSGGDNTAAEYDYDFVMSVTYNGADGTQKSGGVIYYNRSLEHSEYEDDESEQYYSLEGIMVLDGSEYRLEGTHLTENEEDGAENEYRLEIDMGGGRTMLVEQSTESEEGESEGEYHYTLYEAGTYGRTEIASTHFVYEQEDEDNELELRLTIKESGKQDEVFIFEREDDEIYIRLSGSENAVYRAVREDGRFVYYRGETQIRPDGDDDDDDDDDDRDD